MNEARRLRLAELLLEPNDDPFQGTAMRTRRSSPTSGRGLQYDWDREDARTGYVPSDSLGFMDGPSAHPYSSTPITQIGAYQLPNAAPLPGFTPVPPGIFDEWRKHAERGMKGLIDYYYRTFQGGGGSSGGGWDPECDEEWKAAIDWCRKELAKPNPSRAGTGGYGDIANCARGRVSQDCGGNPVDWGSRRGR
jgi:hypothetical protein